MVSRPTSLRLGHQRLKIKWVREAKWMKNHDPTKCGHYWYAGQLIAIRLQSEGDDYAEECLREFLLHEILHACYEQASLTGAPVPEDDVKEEWLVQSMTMPLIACMQDNPEVFDYIMDRAQPVD